MTSLVSLEESPWAEANRGKALNANSLAQRLKEYRIASKNLRLPSGVVKGYAAEDFADAWSRYLPPHPSETRYSRYTATSDESQSGEPVADAPDESRYTDPTSADDDLVLCATCGANPVELPGLDCDECMGMAA